MTAEPMLRDTPRSLAVVDERTGIRYRLPIENGAVRATEFRRIRIGPDDPGLVCYDPGLFNTAPCASHITWVDGERGELRYRGYPIEELAARSTFLETAYLLVDGDLPGREHFAEWERSVLAHAPVSETVKRLIEALPERAHPLGTLIAALGALSALTPDAARVLDADSRRLQMRRLIGKLPTLAALASRHGRGWSPVDPDTSLGYVGNFLRMTFARSGRRYEPVPAIERALETLFILHADHEQNCSTNALRCAASAHADPYAAVAAAVAALGGPRHGGANESVIRMFEEIGSAGRVRGSVSRFKSGERRLMGFGHRLYKNYDPRVRIMKNLAHDVFAVTGRNRLIDVAVELERIALEDEYFVSRRLYPNLDFYSGIIYQAIGFSPAMFPVLFAVARCAGWMAQWTELIADPEQKIARPRQLYLGEGLRHYVPIAERSDVGASDPSLSRAI